MNKILAMTTFAFAAMTATTASAHCPGPIPADQCRCIKFEGSHHPFCIVAAPSPSCLPCLYGCSSGGTCNDGEFAPDGLPVTAQRLMDDGHACRSTDDGGACDTGYAWGCEHHTCADSDGVWWPVLVTPDNVKANLVLGEDCAIAETADATMVLCGQEFAVCVGESCIEMTETRWGCQYFAEEGADDLLTCMLTVADEACNGCISGESWR